MSLFHHVSLPTPDPLGGGLREEIQAEQLEGESISLEEGIDEGALSQYWQGVEEDIEKDPTWFTFDNEE
jgi:hypothetical protein